MISRQVAPYPPPGSGVEYVQYEERPHLRGDRLVGGLLALAGLLFGALLLLDKRRVAGLVVGGLGLAVGVLLMFSWYF